MRLIGFLPGSAVAKPPVAASSSPSGGSVASGRPRLVRWAPGRMHQLTVCNPPASGWRAWIAAAALDALRGGAIFTLHRSCWGGILQTVPVWGYCPLARERS